MQYFRIAEIGPKMRPVIRYDKNTGNRTAYSALTKAAAELGHIDRSGVQDYGQKIRHACESGSELDGFLWSYGELVVIPKDGRDENSADELVGAATNGYKVIRDTGYRLETGERVFLCQCESCGAYRLFTEFALLANSVSKCGCVESLELLGRCLEPKAFISKLDLASRIGDMRTSRAACCKRTGPFFARRRIYKFTTEGKLLGEYQTAADAYIEMFPEKAKRLPRRVIHQRTSAIFACCKGKNKTAYGYVWRYADEYDAELQAKKAASDMIVEAIGKHSESEAKKEG